MKFGAAICVFFMVNLLLVNSGWAQARAADDITGTWQTTHRNSQIYVYKAGDKYYGKIKTGNSTQKLDVKNPDKSRRNDPLIGLVILKNFTFDGKDEWEDGKIYDPTSGKTYSCVITLPEKNKLKVRGYVGVSWIGKTDVWTRVK